MASNKQSNTFRKLLTYGGFSIATTFFGVLSLPVLTSFLEPSEYGELGLVLAALSLMIPVNTLSNQHNVQVTKSKRSFQNYALFWNCLCSLSFLISSILLVVIGLAIYFFQLPFTLLLIPFLSLSRSLRLLKQAELVVIGKDFLYGFSTLIISVLGFFISLLIFNFYMAGVHIRLESLILAEILTILFVLRVRFSVVFDLVMCKRIWVFGWPLILSALPAWLVNESSRLFLLNKYSLDIVGLYTLSFQISVVYLKFNTVLGNTFVKKIFEDIGAAFKPLFIFKVTLIQITCALAFTFTTNFLGVYVLPESYLAALPVSNLLILGVLFQSFGLLPSYYLSYHNKNKFRLYALSFAAIVSIILNANLIPSYGAIGAAIAFISAMFVYGVTVSIFVFLSLKNRG